MRILHFYKTSYPDTMGGVEQVIHQLASGASRHGVDSKVLSLTPERVPRSIDMPGYQVHRARMDLHFASTSFSASAFLRFSELAKQADIVHYHFPWPFMDLVHFIARVGKPTLVTYHSDIVRQRALLQLYRPLRRMFLGSVDRIVATSANYFASSDVLGKYGKKVEIIPIGLDKASYSRPDARRMAYWKSRVGDRFFLFIGVLRYYKGLHILLEAIQHAPYPVAIVGAGPIEMELKAQAEALGVRNVHFLGHLPEPDKVALLQLSFAAVFPSHLRSEAFGISLLEGAMFGKPLISSEIGTGTTFINIHGETGIVVPPANPSALREAMAYLWEHPELATDMGKRAEARYWAHFTAERMVREYLRVYEGMLAGS